MLERYFYDTHGRPYIEPSGDASFGITGVGDWNEDTKFTSFTTNKSQFFLEGDLFQRTDDNNPSDKKTFEIIKAAWGEADSCAIAGDYHPDSQNNHPAQGADYSFKVVGRYLGNEFNGGWLPSSRKRSLNRFLFQGREWDHHAEAYDFRARWYSPRLGRFLSRDPMGYLDSMNLYQFVGDNPLVYKDPTGCSSFLEDIGTWIQVFTSSEFYEEVANRGKAYFAGVAHGVVNGITCGIAEEWFGLNAASWLGEEMAQKYAKEFMLGNVVGEVASTVVIGMATGGASCAAWVTRSARLIQYAHKSIIAAQIGVNGAQMVYGHVTGNEEMRNHAAIRLGGFAAGYALGKGMQGMGAMLRKAGRSASNLVKKIRFGRAAKGGMDNGSLLREIARRAERKIGAAGAAAGSRKHAYAKRLLNKYQGMFGDRGLQTEISWLNKETVRYGMKGSIRMDVWDATTGAVWDYKFGKTAMSASQRNGIMQHGLNVKSITEIMIP